MKDWPFPTQRRNAWWRPTLTLFGVVMLLVAIPFMVIALGIFGLLAWSFWHDGTASGQFVAGFMVFGFVLIMAAAARSFAGGDPGGQ